eukprot:318439_1
MGNCMTNTDDAVNHDEHNHHTIDNDTSIHQSETNNTHVAMNENKHNNKIKITMAKDDNVKIFQSNQFTNCDSSESNGDNQCQALERMVVGLKYYETLFTDNKNIKMTQDKKDAF